MPSSFGPFAIDEAQASLAENVTKAYGLMGSLFRYIQANASKNLTSWGLLFAQDDKERVIVDGDNVLTCRHYFTASVGSACHRRLDVARRRCLRVARSTR